jgi:hypothetical protein
VAEAPRPSAHSPTASRSARGQPYGTTRFGRGALPYDRGRTTANLLFRRPVDLGRWCRPQERGPTRCRPSPVIPWACTKSARNSVDQVKKSPSTGTWRRTNGYAIRCSWVRSGDSAPGRSQQTEKVSMSALDPFSGVRECRERWSLCVAARNDHRAHQRDKRTGPSDGPSRRHNAGRKAKANNCTTAIHFGGARPIDGLHGAWFGEKLKRRGEYSWTRFANRPRCESGARRSN